jgi:hypothetical protein
LQAGGMGMRDANVLGGDRVEPEQTTDAHNVQGVAAEASDEVPV